MSICARWPASTSPFRRAHKRLVGRQGVADARGEVVVEVDRVVDASGPQGVAFAGPVVDDPPMPNGGNGLSQG